MTPALARLCRTYGVIWQYKDGAGRRCEAPDQTCIAILQAMGVDISGENMAILPVTHVIEAGVETRFECSAEAEDWQARLECGDSLGGKTVNGAAMLPPLPIGVHDLVCGKENFTLISAPKTLPLPDRGWGITAPLYGLNAQNGSPGTYQDLAELAEVCAAKGAGFIGINPVHAGFANGSELYSPYSPSSRQRLNTRHIALPDQKEPGAMAFIDYKAHDAKHAKALEAAFSQRRNDLSFDAFISDGGEDLRVFATHQALGEIHGPYWKNWPKALQDPNSPEVKRFTAANPLRLEYHSWLQWMASQQLNEAQARAKAAGMTHGLYLDLAVGTHPDGAETWADGRAFARGISLGAPADAFSAAGQNWCLAPLNPLALKQQNFAPFIATLRAQLRHAGMLRIDHALGFERSFWIPEGHPGAYVAMPREALFALVRIEATRAGAVIIGEDLGNVPDGLRSAMESSGILGCRVVMFERKWKSDRCFVAAEDYSVPALASLSTHDLPTLHGWCSGRDIDWREKLGETSKAQADIQRFERKADCAAFSQVLDNDAIDTIAAHRFLAATASRLVAVQIEDILQLIEQANLPGTIDSYPNWRRVLPISVDDIGELPMMNKLSAEMKARERGFNAQSQKSTNKPD